MTRDIDNVILLIDTTDAYVKHILDNAPCPPDGMDGAKGDETWKDVIRRTCMRVLRQELDYPNPDGTRLAFRLEQYAKQVIAVSNGSYYSKAGMN